MPESTELARRQAPQLADVAAMSDADLERMYRVAKALALSKRFPDAKTADEAFAKVLLGRDLGLSPTQAMTGIHIVEGKPQIAAVTLAAFVRKSERYEYVVKEMTDESCTIEFWGTWIDEPLGTSTFTLDEARKAGLVKDKSNWVKWPKNMVFARAMSNGVKWYCPDLMGGVPIYTEGDTFEGTAAEIATGHGDGSEPGWGDMSAENVAAAEAVIERAQALGHAGLSDRATAQMTLSGQPESVVAAWIERATRELDEFEARQDPPADEIMRGEHGVMEQAEGPSASAMERDALRVQLGTVLDRIAAAEAEGDHDALNGPAGLYAEQERLEGLLGDEPGDEGQETMPL